MSELISFNSNSVLPRDGAAGRGINAGSPGSLIAPMLPQRVRLSLWHAIRAAVGVIPPALTAVRKLIDSTLAAPRRLRRDRAAARRLRPGITFILAAEPRLQSTAETEQHMFGNDPYLDPHLLASLALSHGDQRNHEDENCFARNPKRSAFGPAQ